MGKVFVVLVASFAALGSYLSGFGIGSGNGLQNFSGLLETFGLTNENSTNANSTSNSTLNNGCTETTHLSDGQLLILGMMVSITALGGALGNLFGGKPTDYAGRKVSLLFSGVLVVMGSSLQSASFSAWMFIAGRFIIGLGTGLFYMAGPVYIAEIAPKNIRGALTSLVGPGIALGILTGNLTNLGLSRFDDGWRVSGLLLCLFGSIYIMGVALLPGTPRWLMLKNRETEAREVLRKFVASDDVESIDEEIADIKEILNDHTNPNCIQELRLLMKWKNLRRVMLGVPLHFFCAGCGTAVYYYSEPLLCSLGVVPFVSSILIGILTLGGTLFTSGMIDKFGRKSLLLVGGVLMAMLASTAATLIYVFNLEEEDNLVVGYIVVCLVSLFMLVYSSSWYIIPWVVTSEIFPLEVRGIAVGISTSTNWLTVYTFTQTFPFILSALNSYGSLYMMAGIDILACLFFLFLLPETKGVSLEEMEQLFDKPWLERIDLFYYLRFGCFCPQRRKKEVDLTLNSDPSSDDKEIDNKSIEQRTYALNNSYYLKEREISRSDSSPHNDEVWDHYWEEFEEETKDLGKESTV